jgi:hypothetical protein
MATPCHTLMEDWVHEAQQILLFLPDLSLVNVLFTKSFKICTKSSLIFQNELTTLRSIIQLPIASALTHYVSASLALCTLRDHLNSSNAENLSSRKKKLRWKDS